MLYYYFTSKEGLYVAVLKAMYIEFANRESNLDLSGLKPSDAIRSLAESIWTHLQENPRWLSLINNENLSEGRYLQQSAKVRETLSPVVELIRATLAAALWRGISEDVMH